MSSWGNKGMSEERDFGFLRLLADPPLFTAASPFSGERQTMPVNMQYSKTTRGGGKGKVTKRISVRGAKSACDAGRAIRRVNR